MSPLHPDPIAQCRTAEGVTKQCDDALRAAETLAAEIRTLQSAPEEALTWDATFGAFDRMMHAVQEAICIPQLMTVGHPDVAVREAAASCEPKVNAFITPLYMDDAIAAVLKRAAARLNDLSPARTRLVEETLRDYRRNGLELNENDRKRLQELNEALTNAGQAFEKNLAETTLWIEITPEQMDGLPETYQKSHPTDERGLVRITTDYPDLLTFMRYAHDRNAAADLSVRSQNRAADKNLPLLQELIRLRHEKAKLLGYATWADYVLEPRMAKNAASVRSFLDDLHAGLKPLREKEFDLLRAEAERLGLLNDGCVRTSDAAYLQDRVCRAQYQLDSQKLREYFEVRAVERGIMDIASDLYGITFHPAEAPVWHADVQPFEVKDANGSALGRIYLDLYPREGKYKHAAVFQLRETMMHADGSRELPLCALVCNFPKPGDQPALLTHDEVTTFFHEFGHLLHHIFSTSELASFAGTNVPRDFVEAPSQLFEEWAWARETLDRFAKHIETNAPLPNELFQALIASRTFGEALANERQLFLAMLDHTYHTGEPMMDTTKVMEDLHPEYSPFSRLPNTCFQATFGHLVGYDAAYYGYQWARSLCFDLLTKFKENGLMNKDVAHAYRTHILEPGGSEDPNELVKRFLGRPPNAEAYKEFLGFDRDIKNA